MSHWTPDSLAARDCSCGHSSDWHASSREHCQHPGCGCTRHTNPRPRPAAVAGDTNPV